MPHHSEDDRYPHLTLVAEDTNPNRRRQPAPPTRPPDRGGRQQFARELRARIEDIEQEATRRPAPPAGIHPHLVFRVPLASNASPQVVAELLERLSIGVVGIESDKAIIAFRDEVDLSDFRQAVADYAHGPQSGINPRTGQPYATTQWDLLEYIEAAQMRLWGPQDRIGRRLAAVIGDDARSVDRSALYLLDVELWHRGTEQLARVALDELRRLIEHNASDHERICDSFVGRLLCLARVAVTGAKLNALLGLDVVAEADVPPTPVFDQRAAAQATDRQFPAPPIPPPGGPSVCVLDSGIASNHPLLARNVGHAEAVLTTGESPADDHGHGTMVGALAVFGNIRRCYESGSFQSPITLFSARVLNSENRFDDATLIIHQMRRAVELFTASPYNCRVFNISLGDNKPWLQGNTRQSLWAESLDILAREFKVLFIVSAGNHNLGWANTSDDAEDVLNDYPNFLLRPECGLCEPATAAIPITVGGIAQYDQPVVPSARRADDLLRAVAGPDEPTPITRIGPGLNGAIKPEFVAPAGNVAFEGFASIRQIRDNPGIAVMSFSNRPTDGLFTFDIGTSLAAPQVAQTAAILWTELREHLSTEPHPNLIRAVLATGSHVPQSLHDRIQPEHGEDGVRRVCGYGAIDEDLTIHSADRRVTLLAQGTLRIDTFAVYEVPVPSEFRQAPGEKTVVLALAFDPPVRRRRAEYIGVRMDAAMIRGKSLDEIVEAYRAVTAEERDAARRGQQDIQGAFQSPFRCSLEPGPRALRASTLQRSEWTFQREGQDYGDSWYLVVRAQRTWAPDDTEEQDFAVAVTPQTRPRCSACATTPCSSSTSRPRAGHGPSPTLKSATLSEPTSTGT